MRSLYLLLAVLVTAPAAMAQWTFQNTFPADGSVPMNSIHGLAVDPAGKVWVQSFGPTTRDSVMVDPAVVARTRTFDGTPTSNNPNPPPGLNCGLSNNCRVNTLYVFNADETQASFSPLSIVTLPGGIQDTLGGFVNGSGRWETNSGRGMGTGPSGDIYATIGGPSTLYRFNYQTGAVADLVVTSQLAGAGTAPFFDAAGNAYITAVVPNDPIAIYSPTLDYVGNAINADAGFNRATLVLPDGNTVFALNYSQKVATIYQRDDEFDTTYDSIGVAFQGMAVESSTIHPTTGNIWVSAGSANDLPTGEWAPGRRYQPQTWYEFTTDDVLSSPTPAPRDSIVWANQEAGRPRAIAFSPDGRTAYVGEFSQSTNALQKFFNMTVATEGTIENTAALSQNRPNPFTGETEIVYSLERPSYTRLRVLDLTGREVATLVDGQVGAGEHRATFRPNSLAAGVYVYMLEVDGQATTRRMLHIR